MQAPVPRQILRSGVMQTISRGNVLERPAEIPSTLWSLLKKCWSFSSEDRPSMAVVEEELAEM